MEYTCKIIKWCATNKTPWYEYAFSLRATAQLPLFSTKLDGILDKPLLVGAYYVIFEKPDRYKNGLIYVASPCELTEVQVNIINNNWNKCVEDDLLEMEFEI